MRYRTTVYAGSKLESKEFAKHLMLAISGAAVAAGYSLSELPELHVTAHSLHASFIAYAEAMEWHYVPQHQDTQLR